jgi:alpha-beta hydrolase superfamily lysophospholipase
MLGISSGFAHHGFAVLTFDLRGAGESAPAPESLGYFEQRDALGAFDFLKSGPLPYAELGRPRAIAVWGVSMGGATLLLAAAHEPAIQAVENEDIKGQVTFIATLFGVAA